MSTFIHLVYIVLPIFLLNVVNPLIFFFRTPNFNCTYICLHLDRNLLYQFLLFLVNRVVFPCVLFMTVYRLIVFQVHVVLLYICFYQLDRNLLYQLWLYIGYLIFICILLYCIYASYYLDRNLLYQFLRFRENSIFIQVHFYEYWLIRNCV